MIATAEADANRYHQTLYRVRLKRHRYRIYDECMFQDNIFGVYKIKKQSSIT